MAAQAESDWTFTLFLDKSSDEDDDNCGFSFTNGVIDLEDGDNQADVEEENDPWSSRQSPDISSTHHVKGFHKDGISSANTNPEKRTVNTKNAASQDGGSLSLKGNSPSVETRVIPLCREMEGEMTSSQTGKDLSQDSILPCEEECHDTKLKPQFTSKHMIKDAVLEQPQPVNTTTDDHKNRCQLLDKAHLGWAAGTKNVPGSHYHMRKRYSDWDLDEHLDGFLWGNSGTMHTVTPPTNTRTCHQVFKQPFKSKLGAKRNNSSFDRIETVSSSCSFTKLDPVSHPDSVSQDTPSNSSAQDCVAMGTSPRQLSVQSLCVKTGETMHYLPADDAKMVPQKVPEKGQGRGWERLLSGILRKSKNSGSSTAAASASDRAAGEESPRKKGDQTPGTPSPSSLHRRPLKHVRTASQVSVPDRRSIVFDHASPLMHRAFGKFGAYEDDLASDTSSVMSFSVESVESLSESGESGRGGGGGGREVRKVVEAGSRREGDEGGRQRGYKAMVVSNLDKDFNSLKVCCQKPSFSKTSDRSANSKNLDEAGLTESKSLNGELFTAKFFNRMGQKGNLSHVTHVSHVYRGTILVTDLLRGKLLHMARSGRVIKWFEVGQGSEPWCACVTPQGHVAVTLRQPACVTVWSGNGILVQEFGHHELQSPTGLACDHQGCFIVADERTNRVLFFSPDGHFLRYLTQSPSSDQNTQPGRPVMVSKNERGEGNSFLIDKKSMHKNKEDKNENSDRVKTKKKVRIYLDCSEIHDMESDENTTQKESMSKASEASGEAGAIGVSSMGHGVDTPEPYVFSLPRYVCVSASGHIIVSDSGSNTVKVFTAQGVFLRSIGSSGSKEGQLKVPYGVCSDQDNNIYVADHYNDRISVFSIQGQFLQHALTAVSGLCRPKSIAVRPAHVRKLFVAHGGLRSTEVLVYRLESTPRYISFKCDL